MPDKRGQRTPPWFEGWARSRGHACIPGRSQWFSKEYLQYKCQQHKTAEMTTEKSDEALKEEHRRQSNRKAVGADGTTKEVAGSSMRI